MYILYLIELIDETHALVGQDQSTPLQRPLLGQGVLVHPRREPHGRRALARGVDRPGSSLLAVFEHLRACIQT